MCDNSEISVVYDDNDRLDDDDSDDQLEYESIVDNVLFDNTDDGDDANDYRVISYEEVTRMMSTVMIEVTDVVKLPQSLVRVLLNRYDWDKQKLFDKYFDDNNSQMMPQINGTNNNELVLSGEQLTTTCMICLTEVTAKQMAWLMCGHEYCVDCWRQYIITKINESVADGIGCPHINCENNYVDDQLVEWLIEDKPVIDKYRKLMSNSFVTNSKYLRWCTYPDCSYIIKLNRMTKYRSIKCKCGQKFCFECSEIWHEPTRCDLLKKWRIKCSGQTSDKRDNETIKWMLTNTKDCPKCNAQIEKNGGCNHMACSRCKQEFCWLCLDNWRTHEYRSCNQFDDTLSGDKQSARALLKRYVHYWTRFNNHENSLNVEKNMGKQLCKQLDQLIIKGLTFVDTNFIIRASEVLCNSRQTLMFSYPFAFYVFNNNQSQIFEDNQSNLEINTEKLSHHLEAIHNDINNLKLLKPNILDETNYCEKRCEVLIDHVNEGYDKEFWHFYDFD